MNRIRLTLLALALVAAFVPAAALADDGGPGAVYTLTNSPSGNAVLAFGRGCRRLAQPAGPSRPAAPAPAPASARRARVILSDDGKQLFAVNAGSNTISYFRVAKDGLELVATAPSGGTTPISVTVHGDLLYALNGAARLDQRPAVGKHSLTPLAGSTRRLGTGSARAGSGAFSPDGDLLVVTEKASSAIDTTPSTATATPDRRRLPSSGATPFGFDFDRRGHLLVSNAADAASSYDICRARRDRRSAAPSPRIGRALLARRVEERQVRLHGDAGGGSISGFSVGRDGNLRCSTPSGATWSFDAARPARRGDRQQRPLPLQPHRRRAPDHVVPHRRGRQPLPGRLDRRPGRRRRDHRPLARRPEPAS